jgi:DNA-binding CsgD family transcriptional regulator
MHVISDQQSATGLRATGLAGLVDGIGTQEFGSRLLALLHDLCLADHCAVFRLEGENVSALASGSIDATKSSTPRVERYVRDEFWRRDPALSLARTTVGNSSSSLIQLNLDDVGYSILRPHIYSDVKDRVLLYGRRDNCEFGLSVICTHAGGFRAEDVGQLTAMADALLAATAKHVSVLTHKPNVMLALNDLIEIENCFLARSDLPRRELEVCARILFGLSTVGIALDLGIGEESVRTYRKRAYQRLSIGTERELLHWYLARWSAWRGYLYAPARRAVH